MSDIDAEYSVWVFLPDEWHFPIAQRVGAEAAVRIARGAVRCTEAGIYPHAAERITITDGDDFTCFVWERGEGITFPRVV